MSNEKEVQRKAIEKYGEEVGLIYMVGYMKGKIQGHKEAVETYEEHDKGAVFMPKEVDLTEIETGKIIKIRKVKI
ncbi:hypothetical protein ES705_09355 [subsurface metagenome]